MTHVFELELEALSQSLLGMASQAERSVSGAVKALVDRDDELARKVIEDDNLLDLTEVEVDETCVNLLSKAPLATHLRLITVAMKISQNLERIGDEATKIARRSIELSREPQLKPYVDIPRMAEMALAMLREALDAFVHRAPEAARALVPRDKAVDELNRQVHRELVSFMIEAPSTISRCLNLMVIAKSLERIADHAKNIAEEIFYLYEAKDIRHPGSTGVQA